MMRQPITWSRAVRAIVVAGALLLVLVFVAANFVLIDVRLWGLKLETRLAWVVVVPAGVAFAAGLVYQRSRAGRRESGRTASTTDDGDPHREPCER